MRLTQPLDTHLPDDSSLLSTILHPRSHSSLRPPYQGMTPTNPFWKTHLIQSLRLDWPLKPYLPSYPLSVSCVSSGADRPHRRRPSAPLRSPSPSAPSCPERVSKRKRKQRGVSRDREEDPDLDVASQLQLANHGLHSSITPKSLREMGGFGRGGRGGSSNRMAPRPVPLLQPGQHQGSSPTSSGIQHQKHPNHHQPEYTAVPRGSMDERCSRCQRVGDGQSPSALSVAPQQHQMAGYPAQQYQSPAPAHWYGSGAQPTNAPTSQPPQPSYGHSPTSAGPSYSQHANLSHTSTRNPSMYAVPIPNVPSRGGSTQGQEQYYYPGAAAYSQPTQAYQQPPYTSPTHATGVYQIDTPAGSSGSGSGLIAHPTPPVVSGPIHPNASVLPGMRPPFSSAGSKGAPAGYSATVSTVGSQDLHRAGSDRNPMSTGLTAPVMDTITGGSGENRFASELPTPVVIFSLDDGTFSHVPPYLAQANLTASDEIPNPGAPQGDSNANVGATSTMTEPTSLDQHIGPIRSNRTNRRQVSKPYQRPTRAVRKTRPITYEDNLVRLQQRCKRQGADEGAIELLGKVFANEVSLEALTRPLTDAEVHTEEFGVETGRIYTVFLETINEEEGVVSYYVCRLCHTKQIWKNHKDVLRHMRRDHFGLPEVCEQWYVFGRSLTFVSIDMSHGDVSGKKFYTKGEMTRHPCK